VTPSPTSSPGTGSTRRALRRRGGRWAGPPRRRDRVGPRRRRQPEGHLLVDSTRCSHARGEPGLHREHRLPSRGSRGPRAAAPTTRPRAVSSSHQVHGHRLRPPGHPGHCICPGGVDTPLLMDIIGAPVSRSTDKMHDAPPQPLRPTVRDRRRGCLPRVRRASFMTGQAMIVDGGFTAGFRAACSSRWGSYDRHRCPHPRPPGPCGPSSPRSRARSERRRTLTARTVEALWESACCSGSIRRGGRGRAVVRRDDRDVDRTGLAGRFLAGSASPTLPSAAACAAYLSDDGFAEVFTAHDNLVTVGGQFFPNGLGESVDGGYRVSGAGSSARAPATPSTSPPASCPRWTASWCGRRRHPPLLVAVIPRNEVVFADGWHVQGLKGTGSYDYNVTDLFVPERRTFELFTTTPSTRWIARLPHGPHAITRRARSWALGVAKSMLDDVAELARTKVRMGDDGALGQPATFQRGSPTQGHVAGGPPARARRVRRGRAPGARGRRADAHDAGRPAGGATTPPSSREVVQWPTWRPARRRSARHAARARLPRPL